MTQFNLADELRCGGTGLLAQAVADLIDAMPGWDARNHERRLLDLQARAAAVPAGNQAKAPTALDEMRALQEGAQLKPPKRVDKSLLRDAAVKVRDAGLGAPTLEALRHLQACFGWETVLLLLDEADASVDLRERLESYDEEYARQKRCHCDIERVLKAQLTESREALARVEAERDGYKRELEEKKARLLDRITALGDAIYLQSETEAELRKRDAVIEAIRAAVSSCESQVCCDCGDKVSRAPDQAASEAEVTERAIVVGSTWECEPDPHCDGRHVVEDIKPREAPREALIGFKCRGVCTAIGERTFRADHTWVSDPEATESATKEGV